MEDIDWGYCVPDCGNCCSPGFDMDYGKAEKLVEEIDIPAEELFIEVEQWPPKDKDKKFALSGEDSCVLYEEEDHTCKAHDLPRPDVCEHFFCREGARKVRKLESDGYSIKKDIMEIYRERRENGYDRGEWLRFAGDVIYQVYSSKYGSEESFQGDVRVFLKPRNIL